MIKSINNTQETNHKENFIGKKIVILNGGPRAHGNTMALIEAFTKGAEKSDHIVEHFQLQKMNIHGCIGCMKGGKNLHSPCTQKDDMEAIYPAYLSADVLVFASPMYYWGFTGQLKIVLDRLFAVTEADPNLLAPKKTCVMLMAAGDAGEENDAPVFDYYHALLNFLKWDNHGAIIAGGVLEIGDIDGKPVLKEAFELGKSIK